MADHAAIVAVMAGGAPIASLSLRNTFALLEHVEGYVEIRERELGPARQIIGEIRNDLATRLDAQNATILKSGDNVVRFEPIAAKPIVRESVLLEAGFIDELREIVPGEIFEKAIRQEAVPATVVTKTHLTYLKKFANCGDRAKELYARLVDPGKPGRRLVIERDVKRVVAPSKAVVGIALAVLMALPLAACADGSDFDRHNGQCNAAIDAADNSGMAVYCALASEDLAMQAARYSPTSQPYLLAQVVRGQILVFAGEGNAEFNPERAGAQFRSAIALLNETLASNRLPPKAVSAVHVALDAAHRNLDALP